MNNETNQAQSKVGGDLIVSQATFWLTLYLPPNTHSATIFCFNSPLTLTVSKTHKCQKIWNNLFRTLEKHNSSTMYYLLISTFY